MTDAPIEHLQDALAMDGDAVCDLYEVRFRNLETVVRFWNGVTRTWQGHDYEGLACQTTGEARSTDSKNNRPTLSVVNPGNFLGVYASQGIFDLAEVTRKRVLQTHLIGDANLFEQRVWLVGRVQSVTGSSIRLELRSPTDMPVWLTPRRRYQPPEYPFVVI